MNNQKIRKANKIVLAVVIVLLLSLIGGVMFVGVDNGGKDNIIAGGVDSADLSSVESSSNGLAFNSNGRAITQTEINSIGFYFIRSQIGMGLRHCYVGSLTHYDDPSAATVTREGYCIGLKKPDGNINYSGAWAYSSTDRIMVFGISFPENKTLWTGSFPKPIPDGLFWFPSANSGDYSRIRVENGTGNVFWDVNGTVKFYFSKDGSIGADPPADPIVTVKKIAPPTAVMGLVYNGNAKIGVNAGTGYTLSGTTSATNAGTYYAYANVSSGYAWSDGTTSQRTITWSIAKANGSVSASAVTKNYGDSVFTLTASGHPGGAISFSGGNTGVVTLSGATATIVGVGYSDITVTCAATTNYNQATTTMRVNVNKGTQSAINFTSGANATIGGSYTAVASGGGGNGTGNIVYSIVNNGGIATIDRNTGVLTMSGVGNITIRATRSGGNNYNDVYADKVVTIGKGQTIISYATKTVDKYWGDANFTNALTITQQGNGAVTYASNNTSVANINGAGLVTLNGYANNITITATIAETTLWKGSTATYTLNVSAYTITFKQDNGSATALRQLPYKYGASVDLSAITATKANNWTFIGWNTNANATTAIASVTMPANNNLVYYPIFSKTLILKYQYNGGNQSTLTTMIYNKATQGQSTTDIPALTSVTGFVHQGWANTNAKGNATIVDSTLTAHRVTITEAMSDSNTVYYSRSNFTLKVSYDTTTNGGNANSIPQDDAIIYQVDGNSVYVYNEVILSMTAGVKSGWTFLGWNTNQTANTKITSLTNLTSNTTVYAIYYKDITAKMFSNSDMTNPSKSMTNRIWNTATSSSFTLVAPTNATGSGWATLGWKTNRTTDETGKLASTATVTLSNSQDYYALYKRTLTLSYDVNGGNATAPTTVTMTQYKNVDSYSTTGEVALDDTIKQDLPKNKVFKAWAQGSASGTQATSGKYTFGGTGVNTMMMFAVWEDARAKIDDNLYLTISDAVAEAVNNDNIIIVRSITLDDVVKIDKNINLTISGSPSVSIMRGTYDGQLFNITSGTLTLTNILISGMDKSANAPIINVGGGKLVLGSGATLQNNKTSGNGGAIIITTGASVDILAGSTISGCVAGNGGAIHNSGTLNITGGLISSNKATNGGAIYSVGAITMSDGEISRNDASAKGGAIYHDGTFALSGGRITLNNTGIQDSQDGQGTIFANKAMTLSGAVTIEGNNVVGAWGANGSGIYAMDDITIDAANVDLRLLGEITIDCGAFIGATPTKGTNSAGKAINLYDTINHTIKISGMPSYKLTVSLANYAFLATNAKLDGTENGQYTVSNVIIPEDIITDSDALKAKFSLANPGVTFDPNANTTGLRIISTNMYCAAAVVDGKSKFYITMTDAIQATENGEVYLIATYNESTKQYTTAFGDYTNGLKIEIYCPIEIGKLGSTITGKNITFKGGLRYVDDVAEGNIGTGNNIFLVDRQGNKVAGGDSGKPVANSLIGNTTLYRSSTRGDQFFNVHPGSTLTLDDITLDGGAIIDGDFTNTGVTATEAMINVMSGGSLVMNNATITNNYRLDTDNIATITKGGAVYVANGGCLTMNNGATISNSFSKSKPASGQHLANDGGAVYVDKGGRLDVNSGSSIINAVNTAQGASVYNAGGEINLRGGAIVNEIALAKDAFVNDDTSSATSYIIKVASDCALRDKLVANNKVTSTFSFNGFAKDKWEYQKGVDIIVGGMQIRDILFDDKNIVTIKGDFIGDSAQFTVTVGAVGTNVTVTGETFQAVTKQAINNGKQTVTLTYSIGSKSVVSKMIITVPEIDTGIKTGKVDYTKEASDKISYWKDASIKPIESEDRWVIFDDSDKTVGKKEVPNDAFIDSEGYAHFLLSEYSDGLLTGEYPYKVFVGKRTVVTPPDPSIPVEPIPDPNKIVIKDTYFIIPTLKGYEYLVIDTDTGLYVEWTREDTTKENDWFKGIDGDVKVGGLSPAPHKYTVLARKEGTGTELPGEIIEPSCPTIITIYIGELIDKGVKEITDKKDKAIEEIKNLPTTTTDPDKGIDIDKIIKEAKEAIAKITPPSPTPDPGTIDRIVKEVGEQIDELVNKAKEKAEIDKVKDKAIKEIEKLPNLVTDPDKLAEINKVIDLAEKAKDNIDIESPSPTVDEIKEIVVNVTKAIGEEVDNAKAKDEVDKAKEDAKKVVDDLDNLTTEDKDNVKKTIDDIAKVTKENIDKGITMPDVIKVKDEGIAKITQEKDKAIARDLEIAKDKAKAEIDEFAKKYLLPDGEYGTHYEVGEIQKVVDEAKHVIDQAKDVKEVAEKLIEGKENIIKVAPKTPTGEINYNKLIIEKLLPNVDYTVKVGDKTYVIKTNDKGEFPIKGVNNGEEYDLTGKTIEIAKTKTLEQNSSLSQVLKIDAYYNFIVNYRMDGVSDKVFYVRDNQTAPIIVEASRGEDFVFTGWYKDIECAQEWNFKYDKVRSNVTIYAGWFDLNSAENRIVITYKVDGAPDEVVMYAKNAILKAPNLNPTKDNMAFEGWYSDSAMTIKYYFGDKVTADMTLYARFVMNKVSVTLPSGEVIEIDYGAKLPKPTAPTKNKQIFVGWYSDEDCTEQVVFDGDMSKEGIFENTTLYAKWTKEVYEVAGVVTDDKGNPISGVTIIIDASPNKYTVVTGADGAYSVTGVPSGTYRLIASYVNNNKTTSITEIITINGANVKVPNITLRGDGLNSSVEIGDKAPDIAVGGMNEIFVDDKQVSQAEKADALKSGNRIEIKFVVKEAGDDPALDKYAFDNKKEIAVNLDMSLFKIVTIDGAERTSYISSVDTALKVIIPLSKDMQNKRNYVIYRIHEDVIQEIRLGEANKNELGEYLELTKDKESLILYTKNFSSYAIAFDQPLDWKWVIIDTILGIVLLLAIVYAGYKEKKRINNRKDNANNSNSGDDNQGENNANGVATSKVVKTNSFLAPMLLLGVITVIPTVGPILCGTFTAGIAATAIYVATKAHQEKKKAQAQLAMPSESIAKQVDIPVAPQVAKQIDIPVAPLVSTQVATPVVANVSKSNIDLSLVDDKNIKLQVVDDDDDGDSIKVYRTNMLTGKVVLVHYRKSFMAKLIQADPDPVQNYYTELKNYILSYNKVKSRISWNCDTFNSGRNQLVKLNVRGKTLVIYLALDPLEYENSKYIFDNESDIKLYENVPLKIKVKNNKRLANAKELIDVVMAKYGLTKGVLLNEDYHKPYEEFEQLLSEELIKEVGGVKDDDVEKVYTSFSFDGISKKADKQPAKRVESITVEQAKSELSDAQAISYLNKATGYKSLGGKKTIINVDTLCANFESSDTVTIEKLYEKKLVARKYGQIKVLARGVLTKSLTVVAEDFSADAIKMIVLMNGEVLTRK